MTENEVIEVLKNEKECVLRNIKGCDRDCEKCDLVMDDSVIVNAYDRVIMELQENQQYRAIGTVEECQEARERQRAKKPIEYEDKYYACPNCGNVLMAKWEKYPLRVSNKKNGLPYCLGCGQSINWSE